MRGDKQAQGASGQANANANTFMGNANSLFSTLTPQLEAEAINPSGYNPTEIAQMETGAQQSAGGTEAGAVGEGGLLAARTRNAGAAQNAVADASRGAGEQLSKNALGIRVGNAQLKERQRENATSGLEGLTGIETNASNNALGEVANNVNANTNAANESWNWARYILDPVLGAAGKASAGGG
jgi:hypothetical protein